MPSASADLYAESGERPSLRISYEAKKAGSMAAVPVMISDH
jgi:hypothetical protein